MSSSADTFVVESALESQNNDVFFNQKKWNYIVDSTSNSGTFTNQIQFNLNTLASQGQWVNLSEAYIQFPIRTRIYNSGSGSQDPATTGGFMTVLKNGFHHMIDSVNIVLDNTNIQMNQNFENVNATFKILTEWDENQYKKLGPTLGFSELLDDFPAAGFNNTSISTLIPSARGFDLSTASNTSIPQRQAEQNIDVTQASNPLNAIMGATDARNIGKSAVTHQGQATAVGDDIYVQFVLATIRLSDLSDSIAKLPPIKNLRGYVYVNYNGSINTFTTASTGTLTTWSYSSIQGRSTPVMIQNKSTGGGFQPDTGNANTWSLECTVSGKPSNNLTAIQPPINYARLVSPYYSANPEIDSALSQTKKIHYLERFINNFSVNAKGTFNGTVTPGIVNPKKLILIPYYSGIPANTGSVGGSSIYYEPYQSPFETAPATTSVFPVLKNLQVTVGNVPMFLNPVNMDYEQFLNEVSNLSIDGSTNNETAAGLLNQRLWSSLYRFYSVDISRRLVSEDGSSKGIQISFDNATNLPVQVFAFVLYEKQFTIDTASCTVSK